MNSEEGSDTKFQYRHCSYKLDYGCLESHAQNLCSQRRRKPSLNLVSNCIPVALLQRKILFLKGRISFKMLPLKLVRPSKL